MTDGTAPTFMIPGVSKAGTTSLHHYLATHDDVYMSTPKELHFFEREENYRRGLDYYESLFDGWTGEPVVGESSPPYWYHGKTYDDGAYRWAPDDDAPTRIHEAYPEMKFVISLRNPVTRAYSQYWKNVRQAKERAETLQAAVESELSGERDRTETPNCWVYANRYAVHLEEWFELFDRDQVRFVVLEEWKNDVEGTLNDICRFLGIEPKSAWEGVDDRKNVAKTPRNRWVNHVYHDYLERTGIGELVYYLNLRRGYPEMPADTERLLYEVFAEDIAYVEDLLGRELPAWSPPDDTEFEAAPGQT